MEKVFIDGETLTAEDLNDLVGAINVLYSEPYAQIGESSVTVPGRTMTTVNVSFPKKFGGKPSVAVNLQTNGPDNRDWNATNITPTGFQFRVYADVSSSSTLTFNWTAVGPR